MVKGLKLKVRKFWGGNSYVSRSYKQKTGRDGLIVPSIVNRVKQMFAVAQAFGKFVGSVLASFLKIYRTVAIKKKFLQLMLRFR